jgi:hypothetical protein
VLNMLYSVLHTPCLLLLLLLLLLLCAFLYLLKDFEHFIYCSVTYCVYCHL